MARPARHGLVASLAPGRSLFLAVLLSLVFFAAAAVIKPPLTPVKVAFLTDCAKYSNWQSLSMIFSFKMSGQPGTLTRVMCCSPESMEKYPKELLEEVETHIAPSYTIHPVTHDNYAAYNKPEAVIDWLQHATPKEEWVLVLDSDMIMRRPFLVEVMQPKKGLAIGARYTYMIGVNNELALRHIPEVVPRNDTLAGPSGRRGDQVGGFFFYQRDDLKRMSTLWLKYTEDVRADDMVRRMHEHSTRGHGMHNAPLGRMCMRHATGHACRARATHACDMQCMRTSRVHGTQGFSPYMP